MHVYYYKLLESFGLAENEIRKIESVAHDVAGFYNVSLGHVIGSMSDLINPMGSAAQALRTFQFEWDQDAVLNHRGGRGIHHRER